MVDLGWVQNNGCDMSWFNVNQLFVHAMSAYNLKDGIRIPSRRVVNWSECHFN